VLVAVSAAVSLPLGLYFRANPDDLSARSSVVSIAATEEGQESLIAALGDSLARNLGMFVWRGDDTLRHNLPERPVFDWIIAPFFLLGTVWSLRRVRRPEHAALWLWLTVMLLPGVLSDSAPHFLRTIGLLPAIFALPAFGLLVVASWLRERLAGVHPFRQMARLPAAMVVGLLVLSQLLSWHDYFVQLPAQPGLEEAFDAPRASLARVAGDPPPGLDLNLPTPGWSYATIRFLRPRTFELPSPRQPAQARFGTNVVLLGYDLEPTSPAPGRPGRLVLYWQTLREMGASYIASARVVDEYNRVWWQRVGPPGGGTLPTDTWQPGEIVWDRHTLRLNEGTPPGEYQLEVALANPDGGRRLAIFDAAGRQVGTSIKLPGIQVKEQR
jgi:hypothetical protein